MSAQPDIQAQPTPLQPRLPELPQFPSSPVAIPPLLWCVPPAQVNPPSQCKSDYYSPSMSLLMQIQYSPCGLRQTNHTCSLHWWCAINVLQRSWFDSCSCRNIHLLGNGPSIDRLNEITRLGKCLGRYSITTIAAWICIICPIFGCILPLIKPRDSYFQCI